MNNVDNHIVSLTKKDDYFNVKITNIESIEDVKNIGDGFCLNYLNPITYSVLAQPNENVTFRGNNTFGYIDFSSLTSGTDLSFNFYLGITEKDITYIQSDNYEGSVIVDTITNFDNYIKKGNKKAISANFDVNNYLHLELSEKCKLNLTTAQSCEKGYEIICQDESYILYGSSTTNTNLNSVKKFKSCIFTTDSNTITINSEYSNNISFYGYANYLLNKNNLNWSNIDHFDVYYYDFEDNIQHYSSNTPICDIKIDKIYRKSDNSIYSVGTKYSEIAIELLNYLSNNTTNFVIKTLDSCGKPNFQIKASNNIQNYFTDEYVEYLNHLPLFDVSVDGSTITLVSNFIGLKNESYYLNNTLITDYETNSQIYAIRQYNSNLEAWYIEKTSSSYPITSNNESELKLDNTYVGTNISGTTTLNKGIVGNVEQGYLVKKSISFTLNSDINENTIKISSDRFDDQILIVKTGYTLNISNEELKRDKDVEVFRGYNSEKENFKLYADLYSLNKITFADNIGYTYTDDLTKLEFSISDLFVTQNETTVNNSFHIKYDESTGLHYVYKSNESDYKYLFFVEVESDNVLYVYFGAKNDGENKGFSAIEVTMTLTLPASIIEDYSISNTKSITFKTDIVPSFINEDVYRLVGDSDPSILNGNGLVYDDTIHERLDYGSTSYSNPVDFYNSNHLFEKDYVFLNGNLDNQPMYYHSGSLIIPVMQEDDDFQIEYKRMKSYMYNDYTNTSSNMDYYITNNGNINLGVYTSALASESETSEGTQYPVGTSGEFLFSGFIQTLSSTEDIEYNRACFRFDYF